MRTRFLPTDYFTTSTTNGSSFETLGFLQLPLAELHSPEYHPSLPANPLDDDGGIAAVDVSGEIEKLPIDDALSMFLSDVLPHLINGADLEERVVDGCCERYSKVVRSEEKDGRTPFKNGENGLQFVHFEIPQMDISSISSQESSIHSQVDCLKILSEISHTESTLASPMFVKFKPCNCDDKDLASELRLHDHHDIQPSVYSVDDLSLENSVEPKVDLLEDVYSVQGEFYAHNIKFPLFEVGEESMGILGRISMVDKLQILEHIEMQQLAPIDEIFSNNMELLASTEFDLIKYLLHHSLVIQCLEDTKFPKELDLTRIFELSHSQEYSTINHREPDAGFIWSTDGILFDEFLFFDSYPYHFSKVITDAAKEIEAETCESMFGEAMNFRNFNELIVCRELTLMDNSFKSLPVPIFSDQQNIRSLHMLVEDVFSQLDWQSSSASDGLYLDWHFLGDSASESVIHSTSFKMLWDMDIYNIDAAMISIGSGRLIYDFILSESHSNKPNADNYKEILNLPGIDISSFHSGIADSSSLTDHGGGRKTNGHSLPKTGVNNVPAFGESMSSDLEFFLNPRNYVMERESIRADKLVNANSAANATTAVQQKLNVRLHQIQLSHNIQLLIDHLWKNFLTILEKDKELIQLLNQYQASNDLTLLHIPKEKFKLRLQEKTASSSYMADNDDSTMVLTMLCAIKQMAFYLCYYGVQATYLYIDKLRSNLQCVKSGLSSFYILIRDENEKAKNDLSNIHPSISVLKEILQTELSNSSSKCLLVSDHVFWCPLKRLLNYLKISYNEPEHIFSPRSQQHHHCEITESVMDIMLNSDCCLLSHAHVSSSFPFSKFSFIVEYGGSNGASTVSSICPKSDGLPSLYFLKVELEEPSIAKALCHGVDMPKSINLENTVLDSTAVQKESSVRLIDHVYGPADAVKEDQDCTTIESISVRSKREKNISSKPFCPDTIIIVNTRNFNEEMVISRRSTYQRILEMEQERAQIVERDLCLPVDVILSSAVCLTWYDCKNIRKKASAPDEAFSCLPLCVESIAASSLTSLSFAFSCCILIFEGECNFLSSIMESSDELYAAAASLGIDVQLFCSYSSEMTEEILLSCIKVATKSSRGLFSKMLDSESLAESFLTSFPSINPLSAHAILTADTILGEFLGLSSECRMSALHKYQIPDESIALLSATSRYGDREDSKSGMTDCSSSVSSVLGTENVQLKSAPEWKKPKYTHKVDAAQPPSDLFHMESQKLLLDDQLNPSKLSGSGNSWLSGNTEIFDKSGQFSLSFDDKLLSHCQKFDTDMMQSIDKSSLYDFPMAEDIEKFDQKQKLWVPRIDTDSRARRKSATANNNNFSRQNIKVPGIPQENFTGEVVDLEDTPAFRENHSYTNSSSFTSFLLDIDCAARNTTFSPFVTSELPVFTNPTHVGSTSDTWVSRKDKRQMMEQNKPHFDTINRNNIFSEGQQRLVEEDLMQKATENSYRQSSQEKGAQRFGSTPLSNALHSAEPQQRSPWTIEFLNRIREKSRLRKQSLPYDLSTPRFGSTGNTSKATKRKSPSILEFYKYEGGSTPQKIVQQKRLKGSSQSLNSSQNKKVSAPCPSWTPVDKRSRRKLSYSTNGNGQSKLVWRDNDSQTAQRRL